MVCRLVREGLLRRITAGRSTGAGRGHEPGDPGRLLVVFRQALPRGVPRQVRAGDPLDLPGLSCGRSSARKVKPRTSQVSGACSVGRGGETYILNLLGSPPTHAAKRSVLTCSVSHPPK